MKSSQRHGAVLSPDSYRDITNSTHHFANLPSGRYTRPVRIRQLADVRASPCRNFPAGRGARL